MPNAAVKKVAKLADKDVRTVEKLWDEAKDDSNDKNNFGLIMTIFKRKVKKAFGASVIQRLGWTVESHETRADVVLQEVDND